MDSTAQVSQIEFYTCHNSCSYSYKLMEPTTLALEERREGAETSAKNRVAVRWLRGFECVVASLNLMRWLTGSQ